MAAVNMAVVTLLQLLYFVITVEGQSCQLWPLCWKSNVTSGKLPVCFSLHLVYNIAFSVESNL